MEPSRLEQQIQFIVEIDKLKSVRRRTSLIDGTRNENTAEHSWHLAVMAIVAVLIIGRSAGQATAIAVSSTSTRTADQARAALLDPGSYRLRTKVAQAYLARGDCGRARPQARAARDLFPTAVEPKRVLAQCGTR